MNQTFQFSPREAKAMAEFVAQLVREGTKFTVKNMVDGWSVTIS